MPPSRSASPWRRTAPPAYVTLQALGRLVKLNPATRAITASLDLALDPATPRPSPRIRGLAVNSDSTRSSSPGSSPRTAAGEVFEVNAATMSLTRTITPRHRHRPRQLPEFPRASQLPHLDHHQPRRHCAPGWPPRRTTSSAAERATVSSSCTTSRSAPSPPAIDLGTGTEVLAERKDHDNYDRCHSCTFSELGRPRLRHPARTTTGSRRSMPTPGDEVNTLAHRRKPPRRGPRMSPPGASSSSISSARSLSVFDVSGILNGGSVLSLPRAHVPLVGTELLEPAEILRGKRLFYDANSQKINQSGYLSCATCHLDGGTRRPGLRLHLPDGRGLPQHHRPARAGRHRTRPRPLERELRRNPRLRGPTAPARQRHRPDERLRLLRRDSRSHSARRPQEPASAPTSTRLPAYVRLPDSFPPSPYRNPDGIPHRRRARRKGPLQQPQLLPVPRRRGVHRQRTWAPCTTSARSSRPPANDWANRSPAIDTPTLRGIWDTAPYLHDGSAATLKDVLTTANPGDLHGATSTLTPDRSRPTGRLPPPD